MLLILLATNSPGMLHPSSAGPMPEPEIIVMFFTKLQVYKPVMALLQESQSTSWSVLQD